ncbi:MAG: GNAT family N-acetyltransferase [Paracoccaceae bacterium]
MLYRAAETRDFRAVQNLMHQLNPQGDALSTSPAQWETLLRHPGTTVWLADNGGPVASVTLHILPNMTYAAAPYALVENVVTLESHRGRGIGRGLMMHVLDRALAEGCYKVMLLTGVERGAQAFYRACGFSDTLKTGMIYRAPSDAAVWRKGDEE